MRTAIGTAFFWLGHFISKVQELQPDGGRWFDFWFPAYCWCMNQSERFDPNRWEQV